MKTPFQFSAFKRAGIGVAIACLCLSQGLLAQNTSYNLNSVPIGGTGSVAVGGSVLLANTGLYNTAVGVLAMRDNTSGALNVAIGYQTLSSNLTGSNNTAVGQYAMGASTTGSGSTAIGAGSLSNNNGIYNTGCGVNTLLSNTTGVENSAVGAYALYFNTASNGLTAMGYYALYSNVSGSENSAFGRSALHYNDNGSYNAVLGHTAMYSNNSGSYNTAVGRRSLYSNAKGSGNAALGESALISNVTGNNNTGLGYSSNVSASNLSNATAIGYNTVVNASNKIRLGSAAVTVVEGPVAYTVSDGRFKTNVREDDVKGLDFIQRLRPVVYNFETRAFTEFLTQDMPDSLRQHYLAENFAPSTEIRQSGFIAQEVEAAAKAAGYDFNGVAVPTAAGENYSLAYGQFVVPLVKGMQEQQAMIAEQAALVQAQQAQIAALQAEVRALQAAQGMQPDASAAMRIFPNPSQGSFTIEVKSTEATNYEVRDIAGRLVARGTLSASARTQQLHLANEAKGTYVLRVFNGERLLATEKLILE